MAANRYNRMQSNVHIISILLVAVKEVALCDWVNCPDPVAVTGQWGSWDTCSQPCDIGIQKRHRHCAVTGNVSDTITIKRLCEDTSTQTQLCGFDTCEPGTLYVGVSFILTQYFSGKLLG